MSAKTLSNSQRRLYEGVGDDWTELPAGIGCTNATLGALERRGLVELRIRPGHESRMFSRWEARRTGAA